MRMEEKRRIRKKKEGNRPDKIGNEGKDKMKEMKKNKVKRKCRNK